MKDARIHSICIAKERGQLKKEVEEANVIKDLGIEGDGHCGSWGRQVTCLNWGSVVKSNEEHHLGMGPGDFAENICIENMDALDLQTGDKFMIGDSVVLQVSQIGKPDHPSIVTKTFGVTLLPFEGRFCRVLQGGMIKKGDPVYKM